MSDELLWIGLALLYFMGQQKKVVSPAIKATTAIAPATTQAPPPPAKKAPPPKSDGTTGQTLADLAKSTPKAGSEIIAASSYTKTGGNKRDPIVDDGSGTFKLSQLGDATKEAIANGNQFAADPDDSADGGTLDQMGA